MSGDNAKIVIEAEDKASAKMRQVSDAAEKSFDKFNKVKEEQLRQLAVEKTLLYEGAEAAEALRLQQQGLDADTAKLIARERAMIEEQKRLNQELDKTAVKLPGAFKETKSASSFLGQLSSFAGGGVLSSLASDVSGLTNRVAAFNKSAAAGEAATLGMKAGLVAASVAIGYRAGSALHDFLFNMEATIKGMERAEKAAERIYQRTQAKLREELRDRQQMIELSGDAPAVETARIDELKRLNSEIENSSRSLKKLDDERQAFVDKSQSVTERLADFLPGTSDSTARAEQKERELERERERQAILVDQRNELQRILGVEAEIAKRRQEVAQAEASQSFLAGLEDQLVALQHELAGTTDLTQMLRSTIAADRDDAIALMDEIELVKQAIAERAELERQKEQEANEEKRRLEQVELLHQREIDRLKEQRILLEEGAEAAHQWRLERQGLSSDLAAGIAAEQAELDRMREELRQKPMQDRSTSSLQAVESRLLTRGSSDDPQKQIQKHTEQMAKAQQEANAKLERVARRLEQQQRTLEVELVG